MTNAITHDDVRHIATLARLKLTDSEVDLFTRELTAILGYVDQLEQVDIENVEPTAHAVTVHNVFRDDEPATSIGSDRALAAAPHREGFYFRVPKVLDQSGA